MQDYKNKDANRSDEELAKKAQAGDKQATEELLKRFNEIVRARARQFFLVGGETEDLVQEGMVGMYFAIRDYREEEGKSFKNFAYLCVTRRIYDAISSMSSNKNSALNSSISIFDPLVTDMTDMRESPEDFIINAETNREFRTKLMKTLSDFEYRVLSLYLEGMSYASICEATGKPFKSVDNALARSKKKLQKAFEK